MTAWRPPYHPQFGQTTWGTLPRRHWGQVLRGGAARLHAPALRLLLFDFDVFFLGTAIASGEPTRAQVAMAYGSRLLNPCPARVARRAPTTGHRRPRRRTRRARR